MSDLETSCVAQYEMQIRQLEATSRDESDCSRNLIRLVIKAGQLHLTAFNIDEALRNFEKAEEAARTSWQERKTLSRLLQLMAAVCGKASCSVEQGQVQLASELISSMLEEFTSSGLVDTSRKPVQELKLRAKLADCLRLIGEWKHARTQNEIALAGFARQDRKLESAERMNLRSVLQMELGEFDEAVASCDRSIDLARKVGKCAQSKKAIFSKCLLHKGNLLHTLDQTSKAKPFFLRAVDLRRELFEEAADTFGRNFANALSSLATCYQNDDEDSAAVELLKEAIPLTSLFEKTGRQLDLALHSRILHNLAISYAKTDNVELACECFEKAEGIKKRLATQNPGQYLRYLVSTVADLANCYDLRGWVDKSHNQHLASIAIWEQLVDSERGESEIGLAKSLVSFASFLIFRFPDSKSKMLEASKALEKARLLSAAFAEKNKGFNPLPMEVYVCEAASKVQTAMGDSHEATRLREELVRLLRLPRSGTQKELAVALSALALDYQEGARDSEAYPLLSEAVYIYRTMPTDYAEAVEPMIRYCHYGFANCSQIPFSLCEVAFELVQRVNTRVLYSLNPKTKVTVQRQATTAYSVAISIFERYINADSSVDHDVRSWFLQTIAFSRCRIVRDALLPFVIPDCNDEALVDAWIEARRKLIECRATDAVDVPMEGAVDRDPQFAPAQEDEWIEAAVENFVKCSLEIESAGGDVFDGRAAGGTLRLDEIQYLLKTDEGLIQLYLTDDATYVCGIAKNQFKLSRLDECDGAFWQNVFVSWDRSYNRMSDANNHEEEWSDWEHAVSRCLTTVGGPLLAEVAELLSDCESLTIVLHRQSNSLPMHACVLPTGQRLCDCFRVTYATSIDQLCADRQKAHLLRVRDMRCYFGADNRGRFELESEIVGRFFEPKFTSSDVRQLATSADIEQATVLHYSGHARFIAERPLESNLGGSLTVSDVLASHYFKTRAVVVLNGCETGMIRPNPFDDHVGFAQAFLIANAAAVISTLWKVLDAPALLLVHRFYSHCIAGMSVACALCDAVDWLRGFGDSRGEALRCGGDVQRAINEIKGDITEVAGEELEYFFECWYDNATAPFEDPAYWASFCATGDSEIVLADV